MSSSTQNSSTSAYPQTVPVQVQRRWDPEFQIEGHHVTIEDSIMCDDFSALAVGRNLVMPRDVAQFPACTDDELANLSVILSTRTTSLASYMSHRLWQRGQDIASYQQQVGSLRNEVLALKEDRKKLRKQLKQMKDVKDAVTDQLNSYIDFTRTKMLELEEEMDEMQKQHDQLERTIMGNSHILIPNGHKRSKSF